MQEWFFFLQLNTVMFSNIWSYISSRLITGSDGKIPTMLFTVHKAILKKKMRAFILQRSEHQLNMKKYMAKVYWVHYGTLSGFCMIYSPITMYTTWNASYFFLDAHSIMSEGLIIEQWVLPHHQWAGSTEEVERWPSKLVTLFTEDWCKPGGWWGGGGWCWRLAGAIAFNKLQSQLIEEARA